MINKNKKAWVAKDFIVAMLLFSGGIALFVLMIGSIAHDYDNPNVIDEQFSASFDKFTEDTQIAQGMWESVTSEKGLSLVGTAELVFFSSFKVISLIFEGVVAAGRQLANFGSFFGIPSAITAIFMVLIFSVLTVYIVFIIINSIRSGKEL